MSNENLPMQTINSTESRLANSQANNQSSASMHKSNIKFVSDSPITDPGQSNKVCSLSDFKHTSQFLRDFPSLSTIVVCSLMISLELVHNSNRNIVHKSSVFISPHFHFSLPRYCHLTPLSSSLYDYSSLMSTSWMLPCDLTNNSCHSQLLKSRHVRA